MVGKISSTDLQTLLDKPLFVNQEDRNIKLSLMSAASKRFSDFLISQPFEVCQQQEQQS